MALTFAVPPNFSQSQIGSAALHCVNGRIRNNLVNFLFSLFASCGDSIGEGSVLTEPLTLWGASHYLLVTCMAFSIQLG